MRIATKITAGYGILIALLIASLVYYVYLIHRMESINMNLSGVNFDITKGCLNLQRDLAQVRDFTLKFFLLNDPQYAAKMREMQASFANTVEEIASSDLTAGERAEVDKLNQLWSDFLEVVTFQEQSLLSPEGDKTPLSDTTEPRKQAPPPLSAGQDAPLASRPSEAQERVPATAMLAENELLVTILTQHLDGIGEQIETLIDANERTIRAQVRTSTKTGEQAERISWIVGPVALALSILVSLIIIRSISGPLRRLTAGTKAIAQEKFYYLPATYSDDEFAQLASDFNTMVMRLEELDELKKDFVSHVSHELKAPLVSMQETTQLLLDQIPGPLKDKQQRLLELNLQSAERLSAMIGNLLDLSRMEAGVMDYELKRHDLTDLISTVLAELEVRAGERGIRFVKDLPSQSLIVNCDGDRIIQVIENLLSNALKFSPVADEVEICARMVSKTPDQMPPTWQQKVFPPVHGARFVLLAISDTGPGVPDPHKEKIFQKFHQVKQGKKISGQGAGLGLVICRTIVEAHRGAIWVEDHVDGGSVFFLLLPAGEDGGQVEPRTSSPL